MKRFSDHINETLASPAMNPGNQLLTTGVANHYTPVQNILTNIRNLFCLQLGIVAEVAEDGLSIKLSSSSFTTDRKIDELLWRPLYNDVSSYNSCSLYGYITSQGLRKVTKVLLGAYYVVYFSPEDIRAAQNPVSMEPDAQAAEVDPGCGCCDDCYDCCCPCPCEAKESIYDEFELGGINEEGEEEGGENKDDNVTTDDASNLMNIINNSDKIVAAKQLDMIMSQKVHLPRDYYFSSVKFKTGDEAIALRWKYSKQLPTGNSTDSVRSLIHIFGNGANGIWVQDFAEDSFVKLPDNVTTVITNILNALGAEKTDNPAVYSLMGMGMKTNAQPENDTEEKPEEDKEESDKKSDEEKTNDKSKETEK